MLDHMDVDEWTLDWADGEDASASDEFTAPSTEIPRLLHSELYETSDAIADSAEVSLVSDTDVPAHLAQAQTVFVQDQVDLAQCVAQLHNAALLAVDCEGVQLGAMGGQLALLSIGRLDDECVWVIDTQKLDGATLEPVFDILRDNTVAKIMFDGRMDWSELKHGYGCEMGDVLDLQLADILSRSTRGEGQSQQMRRLRPYIDRLDLNGCWNQYKRVHRLNGLIQCCYEHGLQVQRRTVQYHENWGERPLSAEMIEAAARDVRYVRLLWQRFISHNWIDAHGLAAASMRYVEGVRQERPRHDDQYICNGLLPQGVLFEDHTASMMDIRSKLQCTLCHRVLQVHNFLRVALRRRDRQFCATCRAMWIRKLRDAERAVGADTDIKQWLVWNEGVSAGVKGRSRSVLRAGIGASKFGGTPRSDGDRSPLTCGHHKLRPKA